MTGPAYYNEIEPFAANWLRSLAANGYIAAGDVDERSIAEVTPDDIRRHRAAGVRQFHWFSGIGGWSYALRLAGVPDDADIWTGSCPCQPFSSAGKGLGVRDPRHLWPAWFALIEQCHPPVIFGEQVASKDGLAWLDLVFADLERCGYSVGAADLCAAGVGAPHGRQRLYFVALADDDSSRRGVIRQLRIRQDGHASSRHDTDGCGEADNLADTDCSRRQGGLSFGGVSPSQTGWWDVSANDSESRRLGDANCERKDPVRRVQQGQDADRTRSTWWPCDWIPCIDGVSRPIEPGTFPLAHGVPARVGRLRGYGNAIVPQVAATFIEAALDAIGGL